MKIKCSICKKEIGEVVYEKKFEYKADKHGMICADCTPKRNTECKIKIQKELEQLKNI